MVSEWACTHTADAARTISDRKNAHRVFIDLAKALYRLDSEVLYIKLKKNKVVSLALQWFRSYLPADFSTHRNVFE